MQTKLKAMHAECAAIRAQAAEEMATVRRPVQNEVLLHYRQARDMLQRAQDLELIPGPLWPLGKVLELRCQALKAVYMLNRYPVTVEANDVLWPSILSDEEDLAIDPGMRDDHIQATLVGYLSPYVRAIGIRGLQVQAYTSMFGEEVHLTLTAPVFP
jgi:hypothetical protein